MAWAQDLSRALDKGLHTDNLHQIADTARLAAATRSINVAAFVVEQIALGLCEFWDAAPDVSKHAAAEAKLLPPLKAVAEAVSRTAPEAEISAALSRAISAYQAVISHKV